MGGGPHENPNIDYGSLLRTVTLGRRGEGDGGQIQGPRSDSGGQGDHIGGTRGEGGKGVMGGCIRGDKGVY